MGEAVVNQHELHPLCTLFPRLAGAEFDALRDDIKTNGLRQPIVLHEGRILDGGNRYRACIEAGVTPKFVEFAGGNLVSFVLSANLHRRHMSAGQQAAIVASAQDWAKAQTHGGTRRGDQAATLPLETVKGRAAESGASERTQRMADKVAKADPELAKKVAHGEVSLPKALAKVEGKTALARAADPEPRAGECELKKQQAAPVSEPAEDAGPSAADLLDDMERDLRRAEARVEELEKLLKTDGKEAAANLSRRLDHAVRQQEALQEDAARLQRNVERLQRDLRACGRAVGESDLDKIVRAVQAFVRAHKREAA